MVAPKGLLARRDGFAQQRLGRAIRAAPMQIATRALQKLASGLRGGLNPKRKLAQRQDMRQKRGAARPKRRIDGGVGGENVREPPRQLRESSLSIAALGHARAHGGLNQTVQRDDRGSILQDVVFNQRYAPQRSERVCSLVLIDEFLTQQIERDVLGRQKSKKSEERFSCPLLGGSLLNR
jgi:hypothetical protein